jgi:prepilin-type N-terminal cleavage/methylation domain-containing protein
MHFLQAKKLTKLQAGFTLIELLVVIAIIGLLSSIVLASLSTARAKAADAAIQSNLVGVRSSAELRYSEKGCYTGTNDCSTITTYRNSCLPNFSSGDGSIFGQANISAQITAAQLAGGDLTVCAITNEGTAWAVAVVFKTDTSKAWCVDSAGTSKQINNNIPDPTPYTQSRLNNDVIGTVCGT